MKELTQTSQTTQRQNRHYIINIQLHKVENAEKT